MNRNLDKTSLQNQDLVQHCNPMHFKIFSLTTEDIFIGEFLEKCIMAELFQGGTQQFLK